jgi:prepilin-type N-terminal cleavage/methylation domain-containing protein
MRARNQRGFTLAELLVTVMITSVVMAAVLSAFAMQERAHRHSDLAMTMEQNLRMGADQISDALRSAGYGVPTASLSSWITWVDLTENPTISDGTADQLRVALCTGDPVATLSADAAAGDTSLDVNVTSDDALNTSDKKLIYIGNRDSAHVTSGGGVAGTTTIAIDTNAVTSGNQGLPRAYPSGTPICRVDVFTFGIDDPDADVPSLVVNQHHGDGEEAVAEGIRDLQITDMGGDEYEVRLTGRTRLPDPFTQDYIDREYAFVVTNDQ